MIQDGVMNIAHQPGVGSKNGSPDFRTNHTNRHKAPAIGGVLDDIDKVLERKQGRAAEKSGGCGC